MSCKQCLETLPHDFLQWAFQQGRNTPVVLSVWGQGKRVQTFEFHDVVHRSSCFVLAIAKGKATAQSPKQPAL